VKISSPYRRALAAFALVLVVFFAATATIDARHFRPTEEFSTPAQQIAFSVVALGGSLAILSGAAFALGLFLFSLGHRRLPVPSVLGSLAGLLVAVLAALGFLGHGSPLVSLPFPVAAAVPGFVAALGLLPLAFLFASKTEPSVPAPNPGVQRTRFARR